MMFFGILDPLLTFILIYPIPHNMECHALPNPIVPLIVDWGDWGSDPLGLRTDVILLLLITSLYLAVVY